jgi:hypothetical protein
MSLERHNVTIRLVLKHRPQGFGVVAMAARLERNDGA